MARATWIVLRLTSLLLAVSILMWYIPVKGTFFALGPSFKASDLVELEGDRKTKSEEDSNSGFYIPTVYQESANSFYYLYSLLHPHAYIVASHNLVTPTKLLASSEQPKNKRQSALQRAQRWAVLAAEYAADLHHPPQIKGFEVTRIPKDSKAQNVLKVGDIITEVQFQHFENLDQISLILSRHPSDKPFFVTLLRDGESLRKSFPLTLRGDQKNLGFDFIPSFDEQESKKKVTFKKVENLEGGSAGLGLALEIYQEITGKDLVRGRTILATGQVYPDGSVLPVREVNLKSFSAEKLEATIFLLPRHNLNDNREHAMGIEYIEVDSLQYAIMRLEE